MNKGNIQDGRITITGQFSVGVEKIDLQHYHLIKILNKLQRLYEHPEINHSQKIVQLLHEMMEYAMEHFATEEDILRKTNYPDQEAHFAKHHEFREKTVDLFAEAKESETDATRDMYLYLKNWLIDHILKTDMCYKEHLAAYNIH